MYRLLPVLLFACLLQGGVWTDRHQRSKQRVFSGGPPTYTDDFLLADVIPDPGRRFTNFSGDLSGRFLSVLAAYCPEEPDQCRRLEQLTRQLIARQKPRGYFGGPAGDLPVSTLLDRWLAAWWTVRDDHMALLWGNGRLLAGLMDSYQATRQPETLAAARRLGQYLRESSVVYGAAPVDWRFCRTCVGGYVSWTQNLEGLVALARETRDPSFAALAGEMAARTVRHNRQHSHGYLLSLRAMVSLEDLSPGHGYLAAAQKAWDDLRQSPNVFPNGAVMECLTGDFPRDEGCSDADWLRLSLALWRATGKALYLDHAERALRNGFAVNQFPNGDFGHRPYSGAGLHGAGERAWWCCTLHGLRTMPDVESAAFRADPRGLIYDLAVDATSRGSGLVIRADSALDPEALVRFTVLSAGPADARLGIRVPSWSSGVTVTEGRNARLLDSSAGVVWIGGPFRPGESLAVRYQMRDRIERRHQEILLWHGPYLLAASEAHARHYFDEPMDGNRLLLPESHPVLSPAAGLPGAFEVPMRHGGYAVQPTVVVLEPMERSLHLGQGNRWQYGFRLGD